MEFLLLGPVQARLVDQPVHLGARKQRLVAAVLALEVNKLVTTQRLMDLIWPEAPPPTARGIVQGHVSRLRITLAGADAKTVSLTSHGAGYCLRCDAGRIDVHRFHTLVQQARGSDDDTSRVALLEQALGLWRGPALADAAPEETRLRLTQALDETRLLALEERLAAQLRLGLHHTIIDELTALAAEHPERHQFTGQLMLALQRTGRVSAALQVYQDAKRLLADELGLDPPDELQRLHLAVLRGEDDGTVPFSEVVASPTPRHPPATLASAEDSDEQVAGLLVPRQLPPDIVDFTGRTAELARVEAVLDKDISGTPVVVAIDGMAGMGKTAFAIHLAHRVAERYPDGQLFVDLHGFAPGVMPISPADTLDGLLRAIGVPTQRIPLHTADREALFRSHLADRRMLVVLDNVLDEEQVRPLLPAAPRCLLLVTSRRRLVGLDQARPITLGAFSADDAVAMFTQIIGEDRLAGESAETIGEVVRSCGRLPLAIRIVASRFRARPAWTLADLAQRLGDERRRLAELSAGQRDVAGAFHLSYCHLDADQRRLFRLLSLHPGADTDGYATAALAHISPACADRLLQDLVDVHLLEEEQADRYRFHDLLKTYAAEIVTAEEPYDTRRLAVTRLLDYYLHTAAMAMDAVAPYEKHRRPHIDPIAAPRQDFASEGEALAWLDAERANLLAVAEYAARHGWPTHTCRISAILWRYLQLRAHSSDALRLHNLALQVARLHEDRINESHALRDLGALYWRLGRYPTALDHFHQALALFREHADKDGEAYALSSLGALCLRSGRHSEAYDYHGKALALFREVGNRSSEAYALNDLGLVCQQSGWEAEAMDYHRQALALFREVGNQAGAGYALIELGVVYHAWSRDDEALDHHREALAIACEVGDRNLEFEALHDLGVTFHATGHLQEALIHQQRALELASRLNQLDDQARIHDALARTYRDLVLLDQARAHWERALALYTQLGVPEAQHIRVTLQAL
ncbi:BTAD domain-containing putative transcriptional regulator [Nonomuraea sp. NPDC049709]|uniref:AfsR/SARP family transcriptional regulator n=1 Tax=Nonomuraea sp. NPDC049709 TaxID=3154736 RepID=UPI0034166548